MEVGLMLNASPKDGDEPRPLLICEATIRSRTPWDAGGYSLPVNHDLDTTISKHIHNNESSVESSQIYPTRHSLSDSRGSLSSLASASTSTHSRFSSASTVGGFQTFSNFTDSLKVSESTVDWTSLLSNPATLSPASPGTFSFHHYSPSPRAEPINLLAQIAERRSIDVCTPPQEYCKDSEMAENDIRETSAISDQTTSLSRTASPTDALLIKRHVPPIPQRPEESTGIVPTQTSVSGGDRIISPNSQSQGPLVSPDSFPALGNCGEFESHSGRFAAEITRHKRAFSEPHNQGQSRSSFAQSPSETMASYQGSEPTPPSSQHPENESPRAETLDTGLILGPRYTPPLQDQQSTCMFKEGCDTGSQPRKAVSHIFGRNKMCTRLIPEHVWVRYCRKHYQRSRYREPKNWPRCQCDLVQKQIQRLEEWSAENERRGEGGVVRSWGLAVRKREQKRLDDLALSKARSAKGDTFGNTNDVNIDTTAPATAVPLWLRSLCGKTYSTPDIRDIFNRVHQELLNSRNPVFPDIEILPHITLDGDEQESPIRYGRRKTPTGHQRSRSMGGVYPQPTPENFPGSLQFMRPSGANPNSIFEHQESSIQHKRKRQDCSSEDVDAELTAQSQRLRLNATTGTHGHESQPVIMSESSIVCESIQAKGPAGNNKPPLASHAASNVSMKPLSSILESIRTLASPYTTQPNMLFTSEEVGHRRSRSDINKFPYLEASQASHKRSHFNTYQFPENTPQGSPAAPRYQSVFSPKRDERLTPQRRASSGHSRHRSTPAAPRLSLTPPSVMPPLPPLPGSQFSGAYKDSPIVLPRLSIHEPVAEQGKKHHEPR